MQRKERVTTSEPQLPGHKTTGRKIPAPDLPVAVPSKKFACPSLVSVVPPSQMGRLSCIALSTKLKAIRIHLYRNGDQFWKGLSMVVTPWQHRTFDSFLEELNNSEVCNGATLNHGVRYIFTMDGNSLTSLDEFVDGGSYIVSSSPRFIKFDYEHIVSSQWHCAIKKRPLVVDVSVHTNIAEPKPLPRELRDDSETAARNIVVIKAGFRPRNMTKMLINKRTACSLETVYSHLATTLMEIGIVKRLVTLDGRLVTVLEDILGDDYIFIASSIDRIPASDLRVYPDELKFIEAALVGLKKATFFEELREMSQLPIIESKSIVCHKLSAMQAQQRQEEDGFEYDELTTPPLAAFYKAAINPVGKSASAVKPQLIKKVNRGYSGEALGIPITVLKKYKVGRTLLGTEFVVVRQCCERSLEPATYGEVLTKKFLLKVIDTESMNDAQIKAVTYEVSILRKLRHRNILQLIEEFDTDHEIYLVMELFVVSNDLYTLLTSGMRFTEMDASGLIQQICSALDYLHSNSLVYRNIKPESLLVTPPSNHVCQVKLADFGLCCKFEGRIMEPCGVPAFRAPEMFDEQGYGPKVDIWSAGVVAYMMLSGCHPYTSLGATVREIHGQLSRLLIDFPLPTWAAISNDAKDFIMYMLDEDTHVRATAEDCLEHPWLATPEVSAFDFDIHQTVSSNIAVFATMSFRNQQPYAVVATTALDKGIGYSNGMELRRRAA